MHCLRLLLLFENLKNYLDFDYNCLRRVAKKGSVLEDNDINVPRRFRFVQSKSAKDGFQFTNHWTATAAGTTIISAETTIISTVTLRIFV